VILQIPAQCDGDVAHVGRAAHFLGFAQVVAEVRHGQQYQDTNDRYCRYDIENGESLGFVVRCQFDRRSI
jgi:hypothetical protein